MDPVAQLLDVGTDKRLVFYCPGCKCDHGVTVTQFNPHGWTWNGSFDKPTLSPSILVEFGRDARNGVCHSFVLEGQIQFLADCTHELARQTVPLRVCGLED